MDFQAATVNLFNRFENRVVFGSINERRICPVTLITGELGGGKTTLLKHILTSKSNLIITAIVNDFAALNIDASLVRRTGPNDVVELSNGCMCCIAPVGTEFENTIWRTLNPDDASDFPDAIVIETSGVTDPTQIIRKLDQKFGKTTRCRLDCVVTVIDADVASSSESVANSKVAWNQLRSADVVIINKIDLINEKQIDAISQRVKEVVPDARIVTSSFGRVPLRAVLDIDLQPVVGQVVSHDNFSSESSSFSMSAIGGSLRLARERQAQLQPSGNLADDFDSLVLVSDAPIELCRFPDWMAFSLPNSVTRMKGFVWFAHERSTYRELQLSGRRRVHISEAIAWERKPEMALVLIGRGFDKESLLQSFTNLKTTCSATNPCEVPDLVPDDIRLSASEQSKKLLKEHGIVSFKYCPQVNLDHDADIRFGIDFHMLQIQIADAINLDASSTLLLTYRLDESQAVLQWALGGRISIQDVFDRVCSHGASLAQQLLSLTHICPRSF